MVKVLLWGPCGACRSLRGVLRLPVLGRTHEASGLSDQWPANNSPISNKSSRNVIKALKLFKGTSRPDPEVSQSSLTPIQLLTWGLLPSKIRKPIVPHRHHAHDTSGPTHASPKNQPSRTSALPRRPGASSRTGTAAVSMMRVVFAAAPGNRARLHC
ncbi:hypothetical protein WJX74_009885 [Apatococcus lobatus]|uniref:Uncharacterized protein n=1 Tax=Apatococcus lobatus TaxID=904363 RepID=A0AAW1RK68_9CHLO